MASRGDPRQDCVPCKTPTPAAGIDVTKAVPARGGLLPRLVSGYPAAAVVLVAHFLIAAASVREKSNTYDERDHITAGYSYWKYNDYRLYPENGTCRNGGSRCLCCRSDLNFPNDQGLWSAADYTKIGGRFLFECGNDAEKIAVARRRREYLAVGGAGTSCLRLVAAVVRTRGEE